MTPAEGRRARIEIPPHHLSPPRWDEMTDDQQIEHAAKVRRYYVVGYPDAELDASLANYSEIMAVWRLHIPPTILRDHGDE